MYSTEGRSEYEWYIWPDRVNQTHRTFTKYVKKDEMDKKLKSAGFKIVRKVYFDYWKHKKVNKLEKNCVYEILYVASK